MDYIAPIQQYVQGICHTHDCDQQDTMMVVLAVEEAISNVIKHGYAAEDGGAFTISFEMGATDLSIHIHEKGLPFDPEMLAAYTHKNPRQVVADGKGLGLTLMKGAMDRVEFVNLGKKGKLVKMSKFFKKHRVDSYGSSPELQREPAPDTPAVTPPFIIRPLARDETLEVSRCAYRAYGYTYREFIYYPKKIWEMNQEGHMLSYVLVDQENTLLGHMALSLSTPDATSAELTAAFVDPRCRGQRLFGRLTNTLLEEADKKGLRELFVHAVTSHPASQKGGARSGFLPTGLLLAALFPDLEFKALSGRVVQKESALLMFKLLRNRPRFTLFAPNKYAPILRDLAATIGREVSVSEEITPLPEISGGKGNRYYQVDEFNFTEIRIQTFGQDVFDELRHRIRSSIANKTDVIYLYLDMENPLCSAFAARCFELDFFFCGYAPGELAGHDALILQRTNALAIDFTAMDLPHEQAKRIMEFIIADMPTSQES
ncbi:GNAT family N-acetyltransferase [Desulfoplanes sp. PS50]|jgi:serine/threonine-protein kinase RsbW